MTSAAQITEIVALYAKHGWKLRRVLLSASSNSLLAESVFGDAEIREASFDGLWFSRRSKPDSESWELRRLSGSPFALVEVFDDEISDGSIEERLAETESRMAETLTKGNGSA